MARDVTLELAVEEKLRDAKLDFKKQVVVGDARPDFLVKTANGDHIVVEVKSWETNSANTARAIHQVERYKELSKAAAAVIVTAAGQALSMQSGAVVPIAELISTLASLASAVALQKRSKPVPPSPAPKKSVFASMPFAGQYDDTFLVAIEPAALASGAIAERVDHNGSAGNVVVQIQAMIRAAKVVVADLSDSRPNVLHEVGFAEALQKPVIQICSTPTANLPFNVRNNQTLPQLRRLAD